MKLHQSIKQIRVRTLEGKWEKKTIVNFGAAKISISKGENNLRGATAAYKQTFNKQ